MAAFTATQPDLLWNEAAYHCFVTMTTVGYGDVTMSTQVPLTTPEPPPSTSLSPPLPPPPPPSPSPSPSPSPPTPRPRPRPHRRSHRARAPPSLTTQEARFC